MGVFYSMAKVGFASPMIKGVEIGADGLDNLPEGGAVLVCNHHCDADPAVLMKALPVPLGFLAASFMGRLPVFKTLLRLSGSVAIGAERPTPWRHQIRQLLQRGDKLVVFPEGQGWMLAQDFEAGLAPFHAGFAAFAHEAGVPVVPMVIEGLETEVVPFKIGAMARRMSDNPDELEKTKQTRRYVRCVVHVLPPISADRFADRPRDEAVPWLMEEARSVMQAALAPSGSP